MVKVEFFTSPWWGSCRFQENVIKQTQDEMKAEKIEWVTRNVAEQEDREIAVEYKIRFVPTTIINGEKWLVGVSTVEQLKEEIEKYK